MSKLIESLEARRMLSGTPEVIEAWFHFETLPQQLVFQFEGDVLSSINEDDLLVRDMTNSQIIPASDFLVTHDLKNNSSAFLYRHGAQDVDRILEDGRYVATLLASGVFSAAGAPLSADFDLEFLFMRGDATQDGQVNADDFAIMASNFNQSHNAFSEGDFNYDSTVTIADFAILAGQYNHVLPESRAAHASADRATAARPLTERLFDEWDERLWELEVTP